jgi:hypothetical protein
MGRPTSYKAEYAKQAAKLCALGATDEQLADFFEVSVRQIHRWKLKYPGFYKSLSVGKDVADTNVERALYNRAVGYTYDSVEIRVVNNELIEVPVKEHVPPDTTAIIFWLKNRKRKHWQTNPDPFDDGDDAPPVKYDFNVKAPVAHIKVVNGKS